MQKIFLLVLSFFAILLVHSESFIYLQNNSSLDFNITTSSTLSNNYWNETFSGNFEAWKLQTKIFEVNRNTGITNGTDFYLTTNVAFGTESVDLKIKLIGNFIGSDIWHSASNNNFSHLWYDNYNFYSEEFILNNDTFILAYRSDLPPGNAWSDFYFVIQEKHPYQSNVIELTDPNILNVLSYNIFMLTPPIGSSEEYVRAGFIHEYVKNYDLIIFSEAFYNAARNDLLIPNLSPEYPYHTNIVDGSAAEDGGVMIFSRWPIEYEEQYIYSVCDGTDCLSSKGVMYAKINKLGKKYNIFGTHTQAWPDPTSVSVRLTQLGELHQFILNKNIPNTEAVIIGGDLNVDKANSNQNIEYLPMLDTLNVNEPTYLGHSYTWDGSYNVYANGTEQEYLDYVFYEKNYLCASEYSNTAMIFRHVEQLDDLWDNNSLDLDVSDHFPVAGRFVFPEINAYTNVDTFCFGETLLLYSESNVNLTLQWSYNNTILNGEQNDTLISIAQNGLYYCRTTNLNCINIYSDTLEIFVSNQLTTPILTQNEDTIFSSTTNETQWFYNGTIINGETNSFITTCLSGNYYCISNLNNCSSQASNSLFFDIENPLITLHGNLAVSSLTNGNQWYNDQGILLNETNDTLVLCEDENYYAISLLGNCNSSNSNIIDYQTIFSTPTITLVNDTIFSSEASNNLWMLDGQMVANSSYNYIYPLQNGIYTTSINTNCGEMISNEINIEKTGITSLVSENIFITPNPVYGNLIKVSLKQSFSHYYKLSLLNTMGKIIHEQNLDSIHNKHIEVPQNLNGIYFVIIENDAGKKVLQKIRIIN